MGKSKAILGKYGLERRNPSVRKEMAEIIAKADVGIFQEKIFENGVLSPEEIERFFDFFLGEWGHLGIKNIHTFCEELELNEEIKDIPEKALKVNRIFYSGFVQDFVVEVETFHYEEALLEGDKELEAFINKKFPEYKLKKKFGNQEQERKKMAEKLDKYVNRRLQSIFKYRLKKILSEEYAYALAEDVYWFRKKAYEMWG